MPAYYRKQEASITGRMMLRAGVVRGPLPHRRRRDIVFDHMLAARKRGGGGVYGHLQLIRVAERVAARLKANERAEARRKELSGALGGPRRNGRPRGLRRE